MEIKPILNLKWYKNIDSYSDGDVEDAIIDYVKENEPEDYGKTIIEHYSWPVYYHLTHTRKNILNWYPFKKEASVLEIGCGLGAITGLLCDRCKKVTAVELSKRRAMAAQIRCREKENLEIIVGNLNDVEFEEKFDYITLIGVLEYQGTYTDSANPYQDFLVKVKSLLKEDGKLLIAIENKYGVKYWCGAPEDHTGIPFDGINQYKLSGRKVRTFSREELRELINKSGFNDTFYYFPFPDYKLPTVVYSEKYMPNNSSLENAIPYYIPSDRTLIAEEEALYKDFIKNNVFDFFANSFLVECSGKRMEEEKVIFALLNSKRQKEYRIGTLITDSGKVLKMPLEQNEYIHNHLKQTLENMKGLEERGVQALDCNLSEKNELLTEYQHFPTMEMLLRETIGNNDTKSAIAMCDRLLKEIEKSSDIVEQKECMIYELGLDQYQGDEKYGKILRKGYLDMIPRNCFVKKEEWIWFDQEWMLENVPSKFILFRGLLEIYISFPELRTILPFEKVMQHYGIDEHLKVFLSFNQLFYNMVIDRYYGGFEVEKRDREIYMKNVRKILGM